MDSFADLAGVVLFNDEVHVALSVLVITRRRVRSNVVRWFALVVQGVGGNAYDETRGYGEAEDLGRVVEFEPEKRRVVGEGMDLGQWK
jgi:hypothetical protein